MVIGSVKKRENFKKPENALSNEVKINVVFLRIKAQDTKDITFKHKFLWLQAKKVHFGLLSNVAEPASLDTDQTGYKLSVKRKRFNHCQRHFLSTSGWIIKKLQSRLTCIQLHHACVVIIFFFSCSPLPIVKVSILGRISSNQMRCKKVFTAIKLRLLLCVEQPNNGDRLKKSAWSHLKYWKHFN